jgi:hypothetical protein
LEYCGVVNSLQCGDSLVAVQRGLSGFEILPDCGKYARIARFDGIAKNRARHKITKTVF